MAQKTGRQRIAGLDSLRALGVTLVVLYHLFPASLPGGYIGVDVFFVISGFIITHILFRSDPADRWSEIRHFYLKRVRRIIPPAVLVVGTVLVAENLLALLLGDGRLVGLAGASTSALFFFRNVSMVSAQNDYFQDGTATAVDHFWSLSIEEQFYLLWPFLLLLLLVVARRHAAGVLLTAAAVSAAAAVVLDLSGHANAAYLMTPTHVFGLMLGAALAVALRMGNRAAPVSGHLWMPAVSTLTGALLVLAVLPSETPGTTMGRSVCASVITVVLLVLVVKGREEGSPDLAALLDAGPVGRLGRISYGVYLWHFPLIILGHLLLDKAVSDHLALQNPGVRLLADGIFVALALAAASLSYRFLEQPVITHGLGHLFSTARRGAATTGVAIGTVAVLVVTAVFAPAMTQSETLITEATSRSHDLDPGQRGADASSPVEEKPSLAVGDSVMLASSDTLEKSFRDIVVDAEVSRQLSQAAELVGAAIRQHPDVRNVIIGLGTNGVGTADDVEAAVQAAGDRDVVLVDTHAPADWVPSVNQMLRTVAQQHANVAVADWSDEISGHEDLLADDGIHPGPGGARLYENSIVQALESIS